MSTKISALPPSAGLVLTDIFPVVDDPGGVPVTQKADFSQLSTLLGGNFVLKAGDTMTGPLNMTAGQAYQYNGFNVITAQTALVNYFFGPAGNLTMTGSGNTAIGFESLQSNTTGSENVATGYATLFSNTTGSKNTANGYFALLFNTTGTANTATGNRALFSNTTGNFNVAAGPESLFFNTTGSDNVAVGYQSLKSNTTGSNNTAVGYQSLLSNTTGSINTATGQYSLFSNTTGSDNVATGYRSLYSNTTGILNTAIGYRSLFLNTTGSNNTAVGYQSLSNLTTPATGQNTAVGYNTGLGITTGNNNTILGANVAGLAAALSNNIILSDGAGVIRLQIDSSGNTTLAGTVATAAGTAALPAHTFSADLNTGLYNIGADSVGLSTGGTLRVTTNTTDLILATAFRLAMASGANQRAGNAVLVGGTVTVANTSVTANTVIFLTRKMAGGTIGFAVTYTVIAATSFTITSDNALDTSTYSYLLVEVP